MSQNFSTWIRPDSVTVPTVWLKCEGKRAMPDGKKQKFIIQDLTDELLEDVIDLMAARFVVDESMFSSLKIAEDPVSMKELRGLWRKMAKDKTTLVALVDDGSSRPRIAGVNMLCVSRKQDVLSADNYKGEAMRKMARDCIVYAGKYVNVFEHYGVTEFLSAFGLLVHPDFRGQGLGAELLKARIPLCKAVGLKATMTYFTTLGGQGSGKRAGFDLLAEIPYNVFKTEDGEEVYPNIQPKSIKIMAMRISN